MAKKKLGQGMDFLFNDSVEDIIANQPTTVRISAVEPNKNQPRRAFDENAIIALADSIRQHGVLQPLLVRPISDESYQIVAGERRWRAARMAGLTEIPVVIKEMDDKQTAQAALIENLQREDLNPIEEAMGYRGLLDEYGMTQNEVAQTVGKSRAAIANSVRLLDLADDIKESLKNGDISVGHAKVILGVADFNSQSILAKQIIDKGLTVRQAEKAAAKLKSSNDQNEREFVESINMP